MNIRTVTVIGANGAMGSNISAIFASFGNAKVYMVGRDYAKTEAVVSKAAASVKSGVVAKNLIPMDYSSLGKCVSESDLVFESVAEEISVKEDVMRLFTDHLRKNTLVCTGTSGLSVTKLAEILPEELRANFFGVHMFNPPYNMSLCELIPTKYSPPALVDCLKNYLSQKLLRTVVQVSDAPAFLANRIGFAFINEAMLLAEKHKDQGGIDYIDAIFGGFTGRSMAPLTTADFVGLDIHKMIVDNIHTHTQDYAHGSFRLPEFAQKLIDKGALGRKSKGGLYKMAVSDGVKKLTVYDIASDTYRDKINYAFPFAEEMMNSFKTGDYKAGFLSLINNRSVEAELCLTTLLRYVVYSLVTAEAVVDSFHSADDAMATGYNWCPPLAMIDALSTVKDVPPLIQKHLQSVCEVVDIDKLWYGVEKSAYDYRKYFRAVK